MASVKLLVVFGLTLFLAVNFVEGQLSGSGRGGFRDEEPVAHPRNLASNRQSGGLSIARGGNDGVVKALEAKIVAMEALIEEYEEKGVAIRDREFALEERRIALDKRLADEDRRIRERENALDAREAEITAYHNEVLQKQDARERKLERLTRPRGCANPAAEP